MNLSLYCVPTLAAIISNLFLGIYILYKNPRDRLNRSCAYLMLVLVIWGCGELIMRITSNPNIAFKAEMLASVGYILMPSFLLYFTLMFTRKEELFSRRYFTHSVVFLPSIFFIILSLETNYMITGIIKKYWGYTAVLGPSFTGFSIYVIAVLVVSSYLFYQKHLLAEEKRVKKQAQLMLIGMLVPVLGGSITDIIFPLFGLHPFEIGLFLTSITGIFFTYAIRRYKLMSISTYLTANTVLSTMSGSLLVFNNEKAITMVNKAASRLLGYSNNELIRMKSENILKDDSVFKQISDGQYQFRDYQTHLRAKDGSSIPVNLNISVLRGGAGETIGIVGVADDLRKMQTYLNTVTSLAETVDARDASTAGHSRRVKEYSLVITKMLNYSAEQKSEIEIAALLHDLGKIGIRDNILFKPGPLNKEEWHQVMTHPLVGARILESLPFLQNVIPTIRHHHERFDGNGYPAGLKGKEIPVRARIMAIADAFDAMASMRPYRQPLTADEIFNELVKGRGLQFDPELLDLFLSWLRKCDLSDILKRSEDENQSLRDLSEDQIELLIGKLLDGNRSEIQQRLSEIYKSVYCELYDELRKLAGLKICTIIEEKLNTLLRDQGVDFIVNQGSLEIRGVDSLSVIDLIEEYKKYFYILKDTISGVVGERLFDRILADVLIRQGEAVKLFYYEYLMKDKILPVANGVLS